MGTVNRSFRASRQLKLHQRAVDALDMIVSCDKKIADAQDELKTFGAKYISSYTDYQRKRQSKYEAIKQRLTRYYVDIMDRITAFAIDYIESKENKTITKTQHY